MPTYAGYGNARGGTIENYAVNALEMYAYS